MGGKVWFKMIASTAGELFGLTDAGEVFLMDGEKRGWVPIPMGRMDLPGTPQPTHTPTGIEDQREREQRRRKWGDDY